MTFNYLKVNDAEDFIAPETVPAMGAVALVEIAHQLDILNERQVRQCEELQAENTRLKKERDQFEQRLIDELAKNALTPTGMERLEKAEAENSRLREGLRRACLEFGATPEGWLEALLEEKK